MVLYCVPAGAGEREATTGRSGRSGPGGSHSRVAGRAQHRALARGGVGLRGWWLRARLVAELSWAYLWLFIRGLFWLGRQRLAAKMIEHDRGVDGFGKDFELVA